MQNAIYLRHALRVIVPQGNDHAPPAYTATFLKNIEALGFTGDAALIGRLRRLSPIQIALFYADVLPILQTMVGAHHTFAPMYPKFPQQVMEASRVELYINALLHYITHSLPQTDPVPRSPLLERTDLRVIGVGDAADVQRIVTRLLSAKTALSATDRDDVRWFFHHYRDEIVGLLPPEFPLKETLALVVGCLLRYTQVTIHTLRSYITTATDVLRVAVALSDGDISLATPTKFRSFARRERRLVLALLESCRAREEDMLRYREEWKRLGERLHVGEMRARYPKSYAAFETVRNDLPYRTFRHKVEAAFTAKDTAGALAVLQQRPGELARQLDHLLRLADSPAPVLADFERSAERVSTPVLLSLLTHFAHRSPPPPLRTFFPKGDVAKVQIIANTLPPLDRNVCAQVVALCRAALIARFSTRPALGKVYVDPRLRDYPVPFAQRSASKSLRTVARGSRLPLPDGATVRFFLWWREGEVAGVPTGTVDIDLSAVFFDAAWRYVAHVSYTNLKSERMNAAHSGDIVTAPAGACEFVDFDVQAAQAAGARYVVMTLNSFSAQPFCNLPECYGGWMMRSAPQSGEIFEPRTVQDKVDVAAQTRVSVPVIFDVTDKKVVWTDIALRRNPRWYNNVEGNLMGLQRMGQAMTTLVKPDLYTLFSLHAEACGTLASRDEADIVFAPDGLVTPFDIALIVADFL